MSSSADQVKIIDEKRAERIERYSEFGQWGAFVLATIQGSIEEINGLKESEGRKLVATREGDYRN